MDQPSKPCRRCERILPLDNFHANKGMPDGHIHQCRDCVSEQKRAKYAARTEAERERDAERTRAWAAANPEKRLAIARKYRDNNREACIARTRAWQDENREHVNETVRERRARNPERFKDRDAKWNRYRKAKIRGAVEREAIDPSVVWERDGGKCHLCGKAAKRDDWHLDHIVPVSLGGSHTYANVAVSHPFCNLSKGSRPQGEQLRIV